MQLIAALRSASARITPQPIGSSGRHGSSLARAEIGFITDVEGDWSYFERCISLSRVLYRDDSKALQLRDAGPEQEPAQGSYFVFGGDAFDNGPGDIRIARDLVQLKHRYPDRVFLLIGNRDVNKLRFAAELHRTDMMRPADSIPDPFWLSSFSNTNTALHDFLQQRGSHGTTHDSRLNRLHYMLERTMGCPNTFEHRRRELTLLRATSDPTATAHVSDDEVCASFMASVDKSMATAGVDDFSDHGSVVLEYLRVADLACCLGNTIFVHGAITERSMGFVPSIGTRWADNGDTVEGEEFAPDGDVHDWVEALRNFKQASLAQFEQCPLWDSMRERRGGEALMASAHRKATAGRSVVVNSYVSDSGRLPPAAPHSVAAWLRNCGIARVVVGHKPVGESPAVLHPHENADGIEIVMADTSFSGRPAAGDDRRGCAVSAIHFAGPSIKYNQTSVTGVVSNGQRIAFTLPPLGKEDDGMGDTDLHAEYGDTFVGRMLSDEWLVRARLKPHTRGAEMEGALSDVGNDEDSKESTSYILTRNFACKSAPNVSLVEQREVSLSKLRQEVEENDSAIATATHQSTKV